MRLTFVITKYNYLLGKQNPTAQLQKNKTKNKAEASDKQRKTENTI